MPSRPPRTALLVVVLLTASLIAGVSVGSVTATPTGPAATDSMTCTPGRLAATETPSGNASISTWTAPASASDSLQTAADIRNAIDRGLLTPAAAGANRHRDDSIAVGDAVVHPIQLNGSTSELLDQIAAQDQGSPTDNFRALVQQEDSGVEFRYLGPTACPPRLALNESIANGSFRVVPDSEHDALYIVVDVEGLYFQLGTGDPTADKWNWGHHALSIALQDSSGLVTENTTIRDDYEVDRRGVEFETDAASLVRFNAHSNQTVNGTASMAPGTVLQIDLVPYENQTTDAPAVHSANATVDRNGEFSATFDLSDAPDAALYRVRIPQTPERDSPHRLVAVGNASGASLGATDHESIGTVLYANGVTSTHGGFLVAENNTTTVAVSNYFGPGAATPQPAYDPLLSQNETLTLTVYRDSDGNHAFDPDIDEPYRRSGEPVQETVNVTVDLSERETTTTTTRTTTTTLTTRTTHSTTATTTTTDANTDQSTSSLTTTSTTQTPASTPGFGVLLTLVALVALLAVGAGTRYR